MKDFFLIVGLVFTTFITGLSRPVDSIPNDSSAMDLQLQRLEERKGAPLTVSDSLRVAASQYAVTTKMGVDRLEKHNEAAHLLIQEMDSTIKNFRNAANE